MMSDTFQTRVGSGLRWGAAIALCLSTALLSSCATIRGWRGAADDSPASVQQEKALGAKATASEMEAELLDLVKGHVAEVESDSSDNQSRIIRKKPYYFKEYSNYDGDASAEDIVMTETESRTAPYVADVKLEKIRHATRLHRVREEARLDNNFLRDTGVETLSYELRNGRWTRVGSFFLALKTEEQVNGEWVTVQRMLQRTVAAEEPEQGWFARSWSRLTGRK